MSTYLVIKNGTETKSYTCKSSAEKPYIKVSTYGYVPLTTQTNTKTGLRVKANGVVHQVKAGRIVTMTAYSKLSAINSVKATEYLTSNFNKHHMLITSTTGVSTRKNFITSSYETFITNGFSELLSDKIAYREYCSLQGKITFSYINVSTITSTVTYTGINYFSTGNIMTLSRLLTSKSSTAAQTHSLTFFTEKRYILNSSFTDVSDINYTIDGLILESVYNSSSTYSNQTTKRTGTSTVTLVKSLSTISKASRVDVYSATYGVTLSSAFDSENGFYNTIEYTTEVDE